MGTVSLSQQDTTLVATFEGELDIYSVSALQQSLWTALDTTARCVQVELGAVETIDFAGVQLLGWLRAVSAARSIGFEVQGASPAVRVASRTLRLDAWLPGAAS